MADSDDMLPARAAQRFPGMAGTEPGDVVGGYELLREIGRGGMAEVWLARRERSTAGKFVAVKMVLAQHVGNERYSRMFASEAEVSAPLSHSNIVQVFDEGEDRGRSYLVMEWVDGADLARLLPSMAELRVRDPYLRLRLAAYIVGQVLHGLSYAHKVTSHRGESLGIVHRDISPQNVLVSVSGDVKVADFGIAHRMIEETSGINVKGKLRYMAPEQLQGRSHAPTVDLYAVGALLHELIEGQKFRHDADDQVALYHQVMTGMVPKLATADVPPELDAVRLALLEPDSTRRPQTADAAVLMLKRWSGYSEMRVELGMLCGLAIGVVRPRTGPIIAAGASTVAPRSTPLRAPSGFAPPANAEPDAPVAPWGVVSSQRAPSSVSTVDATAMLAEHEQHGSLRAKSEPTADFSSSTDVPLRAPGVPIPLPVDRRDLEPTHSSVEQQWMPSSGALPAVEATATGMRGFDAPQRFARPWVIGFGLAALALLGGGSTALYFALSNPPQPSGSVVAATESKPAAVVAEVAPPPEETVVDLSPPPVLQAETPEPATKIEPAPAAVAPPVRDQPAADVEPTKAEPVALVTPPPEPIVAPTAKPAARAPKASSKPTKPPAAPPGPEVTLHVRLEGGLAGAEVKLGRRVLAVKPRFDGRIASGKYAVQYRLESKGSWKSAGTIVIGETGEWKLLLGPSGARVSKL